MDKQNGEEKLIDSLSNVLGRRISRREFLALGGIGALGIVLPQIVCVQTAVAAPEKGPVLAPAAPEANAKGLVIGIPSRCTGCNRCELACSGYLNGRPQPALARIKVARNMNFGPVGAQVGFSHGQGQFGNFLVIQDTCKQCAHPIPCASACPNAAIQVVPPVNARVVNADKCTGCRQCQAACPWGMTGFDEVANKAIKCTLCDGAPECVAACPTSALLYVPWQDKTKDVPVRWTVPAYLSTPPSVAGTCNVCHK